MAVCVVETSTQEAATALDSATILVKDTEDRATLAEREAYERVSRVEVESATELASTCEEVEGLVQKVALLEGEVVEPRQSRELAEEISHGLSDAAADAEQRREGSEREHQQQFEELTLL
jgi:hypothetical protein